MDLRARAIDLRVMFAVSAIIMASSVWMLAREVVRL